MPDFTTSDGMARLAIASPEDRVFVIEGEIDAHTAPQLASHFESLPVGLDETLVLDMSSVSFMDSSGLRVLIELNGRIVDSGAAMTLRAPSRAVARLIEISGLSDVIAVSST